MAGDKKDIPAELKLTYTDILSLGESNRPHELIDGEPVMGAMPSPQHQRIATKLGSALDNFVSSNKLGVVLSSPVDVYISETIVLQPDITFLSNDRQHIDDGTKYNGVPDLVIEILSDATEDKDRTFKFREYARGGATEYWIVSPKNKEIEVYCNSERGFQLLNTYRVGDVLNSSLFPNIHLSVSKVFG